MLVLGLSIAALAGWALVAWRGEARRRQGLLEAASPMGLRLSGGDPFDLPEACFNLVLFGRGHSRLASNVLHGQLNGLTVRLFDYQYETGSGKNRRTHRWQVAVMQTEFRWPAMLCQPADEHDPLEALFGLEPVAFDVAPFAERFRVACEDRDFAYRCLHAQTADRLAGAGAVTIEARDQMLAVYQSGRLAPKEAVGLAELGREIVRLLPESLRSEMAV